MNVYTDCLILEPLVCSLMINYPDLNVNSDHSPSEGDRIAQAMRAITSLDPSFPLFILGCTYSIVPLGPAGKGSGSFCNSRDDGGCEGRIVLKPMNKSRGSRWISVFFSLVKGQGDRGWFTLTFNPTTIAAGDNIHPACVPNAMTGELVRWPSSARDTVRPLLRLGFLLIEGLFRQVSGKQPLLEASTWNRIREGTVHVVRTQFCSYLPAVDVARFLQGLTILYAQTIATGKGIVNLAKLQGLDFDKPFTAPGSNEVTYFRLIKRQGKKPALSVVAYNKEAELRRMRQRKGLPEPKEATVNHNVRLDVTFHSLGVKELNRQARRRLKRLLLVDPSIATRLAGEDFLIGPPESTIRALELAVRILSHVERGGKVVRISFGEWLIPYVLQDILHLDVITGFTLERYQEFLESNDPVAVAWRSAKPADINDPDDLTGRRWAQSFAEKAGVSQQSVYNRRRLWLKRYGIDIKLPNAYYYGVLYYGPNSVTTGKDQQATLAAHTARDGDKLLRLRDKAAQDFDRLRIDVVGATINAPLHQMPVEPAAIRPGPWIGNFTARAPALGSAVPLNAMPQVSATKQKVAVPLPSPKDKQTAKTSHMGAVPGTQKFRASPKQAEAKSPAAAGVRSRTPTTQRAVDTKRWPPNSSRTTTSRREI